MICCIFMAEGREKAKSLLNEFTIISNRQETRKGYIIMEIMSTNVTCTTTYRVEI